ncbi:MAG: hypothetical protein J6Y67_02295 [Lachnospiraceae bacterium]|nr:hypothetical protein [Lachnospiraceae bacterium]
MNTDRNRKLPRLIVAVCVAALAVWIVLMVVLFGDRDGKNDKPAEEKETQLSPMAEPTVTPEQEIRVPEGEETFSREYDDNGNCVEYTQKTPSRHYSETMTYAPMVITEEALESAEQYYYPLSDVFPKAMQEYTEPDVEQE